MAEETRGQEQIENTQTTNQEVNQGNAQPEETGKDDMTMDGLLAQLATLKVENARNKAALDKALHNNGELTKQLRAKMTASEQEEEAKREREEAQQKEIEDLKNYKRRSEARERYLTLGMSPEHAKAAAEAEVAGDMEALSDVQKKHTEALLQAQKAEWLKSRPDPNVGHGEDEKEKDPFLAGFSKM